jgi:hypothetical protein
MSSFLGEIYMFNNEKCRSETIERKIYGCTDWHVTFSILGKILNITWVQINPQIELPEGPGLHLCINCVNFYKKTMQYFSPKTHIEWQFDDMRFIYCHNKNEFETPKWSIMWRPFGVWIWVWILITAIAYSLCFKNVNYGLDILFALLFQNLQCKWKRRWLLLALLLLTVISNAYLGVVTTNIVKPPKEKQFVNMLQMLDTPYR